MPVDIHGACFVLESIRHPVAALHLHLRLGCCLVSRDVGLALAVVEPVELDASWFAGESAEGS